MQPVVIEQVIRIDSKPGELNAEPRSEKAEKSLVSGDPKNLIGLRPAKGGMFKSLLSTPFAGVLFSFSGIKNGNNNNKWQRKTIPAGHTPNTCRTFGTAKDSSRNCCSRDRWQNN